MSRYHRLLAALIGVVALATAAAGGAVAFWQVQPAGSAGGAADHVGKGSTPSASVSGTTVTVTWAATTSRGGRALGYDVRRYTTATGGTGVAPSGCSTTTTALTCQDAGLASGTYYYAVTPRLGGWAGTESDRSAAVTVNAATKLGITRQPSSAATAGTAFAVQPVVAVQDASGSTVTTSSAPVTLAVTGGNGTSGFSCTATTVNAVNGVATFAGCQLTRAGSYTLTATSGSLTSVQTSTITVSAAAASRLVVTSAPVSGTAASTATLGPLTVERQDAFGNPVVGSGTVSLTSSSAGVAVFSTSSGGARTTTVTIPAGAASASFWYGDTRAGSPSITVSSEGLTSGSQTASITAGAPTKLRWLCGGTSCTTAVANGNGKGSSLTAQVQAVDSFDNPAAPSAALTVTITSGDTKEWTISSPTTATVVLATSEPSETVTVQTATGNAKPTGITASASGVTPAVLTATSP